MVWPAAVAGKAPAMTDLPDQSSPPPTSDPAEPGSPAHDAAPEAALDVDAEQDRIDDLAADAAQVGADAEADLEPGGAGRIFADRGVQADVAQDGDTDTPPADA